VSLVVALRTANQKVRVTVTAPDGTTTWADADAALFAPKALDGIYQILNDTKNRQQAAALGKQLFDGLLPDGSETRAAWTKAFDEDALVLVELKVDEADLRAYPWELLRDDDDRMPALLGGMVRRVAKDNTPPPAVSEWPLRMLIIAGTDDATKPAAQQIGTRDEVAAIKKRLIDYGRSIDIKVLWEPPEQRDAARREPIQTIDDALKIYQPHVVHFVGHGTYDKTTKRHALRIETPNAPWMWDTVRIQTQFQTAKCVPRLVFLNACRTGSARESNISLQTVFAERLRVGTVIGMQADVRGDRAARFSETFYGHALVGSAASATLPSIADALKQGRAVLGSDVNIDWALPSLTLRADVPADVRLREPRPFPDDPPFRVCRQFDEARVYADESDARRSMVQWMYPIGATDAPNVLILQGKPASGKSRLLHWCMESWAVGGTAMRYLRIPPLGKNCLKWLLQVRKGDLSEQPEPERLLLSPLDPAPFQPFYDAVASATNPPITDADPAVRIRRVDAFDAEVPDNVSIEPLCNLFIEGLRQVGPIILVFDQLSVQSIPPPLFAGFRTGFLAPIGGRGDTQIRVVLAVSRDDYELFSLKGLAESSARVVDLRDDYSPNDLVGLAVEALRFRYRDEPELRQVAQAFVKVQQAKTGLARLFFCQNFLELDDFRDFERMR
jgi:CHAT domain